MKVARLFFVFLFACSSLATADRPTGATIIRTDYANARFMTQTAHFEIHHDCVLDQNCIDFNRFEQTHDAIVWYFSRLGLSLRPINHESRMRVRIFDDWNTRSRDIAAVGLNLNGRAAIFDAQQNCVFFVVQFPGSSLDAAVQEAYLRTVLQHEIAHAVLTNSSVFAFGAIYPLWLSEGFACLFEVPLPCCNGEQIPVNDLRLADIGSPQELPSIGTLLRRIQPWDGDRVNSAKRYAHAWALAHFLIHRHRDGMRSFLQKIMTIEPNSGDVHHVAIDEFEAAFGPADNKLDKEWRAYVADLIARAKTPDHVATPSDANAAP